MLFVTAGLWILLSDAFIIRCCFFILLLTLSSVLPEMTLPSVLFPTQMAQAGRPNASGWISLATCSQSTADAHPTSPQPSVHQWHQQLITDNIHLSWIGSQIFLPERFPPLEIVGIILVSKHLNDGMTVFSGDMAWIITWSLFTVFFFPEILKNKIYSSFGK